MRDCDLFVTTRLIVSSFPPPPTPHPPPSFVKGEGAGFQTGHVSGGFFLEFSVATKKGGIQCFVVVQWRKLVKAGQCTFQFSLEVIYTT